MLSKEIMLVLSEKQVQGLIDIDELIPALEQAHIQYSTGKAVMPVRLVVPLPHIQGRITSMPGYLNEEKALGIAIQDVATGQLVYRKALERKVGTNVEL